MKAALSTLVLSLVTLVSTSSFAASSINKSEQLYRVLAQSGLRAEATFEGETAFTAYDLSCTTTSEVPAKVSCELSSRRNASTGKKIHVEGTEAKRLFVLLRGGNAKRGETGVSAAFVTCSQYNYGETGVDFECQVSAPFAAQ